MVQQGWAGLTDAVEQVAFRPPQAIAEARNLLERCAQSQLR